MPHDLPGRITDAPLFVVPRMLEALRAWRATPALDGVPVGSPEHARLIAELDLLGERLLAGIEAHPTRFWVMTRIRQALDAVGDASPQGRDAFGREVARVMALLGVVDVDGFLPLSRD